MSEQESNKESMFSKFSPKVNFFLGLGSALVVIFVVGFFVLLGLVLNSGSAGKVASSKTNTSPIAAPSAPPAAAPTAPTPGNIQLAEITDNDWIKGDRDAKVSVVEFSDLECPYCKEYHKTMLNLSVIQEWVEAAIKEPYVIERH